MSGVIDQLLTLPWGYLGPVKVKEDDEEYWELTIAELPDFYLAGDTREEVFAELRPALREYLASYLEAGEKLPKPILMGYWQFQSLPMQVTPGAGASEQGNEFHMVSAA